MFRFSRHRAQFRPRRGPDCALALAGCHSDDETGSFPAANSSDCLPNLTLLDQNGQSINLSSLKGEYVLINFIYTQCSGTCPLLTSKMSMVREEAHA